LETFDFSFNPTVNKALILDLATCRFLEEKVAVLIAGPSGTGKSHIAQALGHQAIRKGHDVLFTSQSKLLGHLQAARATGTYDRKLAALAAVDLLIVDDFALKPLRSPQDEDFHDLVAERYERRSIVLTSNLDFPEWGDAFPNPTSAVVFPNRPFCGGSAPKKPYFPTCNSGRREIVTENESAFRVDFDELLVYFKGNKSISI